MGKMQATRSAIVQRRRKSSAADKPADWEDWRQYEGEADALAAIFVDLRLARLWEYRLKPDAFAVVNVRAATR